MSFIRDIINNVDDTNQKAGEIRENLKALMDLAQSKANILEEEILFDLKAGKAPDDLMVPIQKLVQKQIQCRAITSDSASKVFDELSSAIKEMVGDSRAPGTATGAAKIAGSALDRILGIGEGEEQVARLSFVVPDYSAIVRLDFAFWARKIQAESMKKYCETALVCVAYKSAVDVAKLAFNDFLALYGPILNQEFGSDPAEMQKMIVEAEKVYSMYRRDAPTANGTAGRGLQDELALVKNAPKPRGIVIFPAVKATTGNF